MIPMGMNMRNHELLESFDYPYVFVTGVESWRDVEKDRDNDSLASLSTEVPALGYDLNPSVNLEREQVIGELLSSLRDSL
ncbi:hypothetical protein AYI68_g7638 [Smittium mucronatum]|uniref:Uncharacterized protein n=1 Tax=Smittium mucronatum TaxID=133383 RepID=A0A1R0GN42_9FUNG|nr:hypothetical protein AYI68_g7638 [Smittium mucronatum]